MHKLRIGIAFYLLIVSVPGHTSDTTSDPIRSTRLVDVEMITPSIAVEMRYFGPLNFVGTRIDGYNQPKCLLTVEAATALTQVQQQLRVHNLGLKVFDCYRPQSAVDHFVRWARDLNDRKTKKVFYPHVDKRDLFRDGYIASRSGHSRGSTVDLTLVRLPKAKRREAVQERTPSHKIDMGTPFDYFDPLSHTNSRSVSENARENRLVLKNAMQRNGFTNLPQEWWHYTLTSEPFPDSYFSFPVD